MRKLFRETTDYLSPNDDGLRVNRAEEPTAEAARSASPQLNRMEIRQLTCKRCGMAIDTSLCSYHCELDSIVASERNPDDMEIRIFSFIATEALPAPEPSLRPQAGRDDGHLAAQAETHEQEIDDWIRIASKNAEDANRRIHELELEFTTLRSTHATLQSALRELVETWRIVYGVCHCVIHCECDASGYKRCAEQLDLALNGAPGTE